MKIKRIGHVALRVVDEQRQGNDKGAKGVRFTPQSDGSGLYCADGAATLGGKIGTLCQNWLPAAEPDKPIAKKLADACQDKPFYGRPATAKRRAPPRTQGRGDPSPFPFGGLRQF
jgi:hypothetical protein